MSLETITITHAASGAKASLLPGLGFNCYQWQVPVEGQPQERLWFDPELLSGKAKPTRSGIPLLFPFGGRIRDRKLSFEGQTYDIADTLDDFGQPIHGFVLKRPWRVVESAADRVTGEFYASIDAPEIVSKWPADYRLRVTYQITATTLRAEIEVHNPDSKLLPFGLGLHPYFRLPLGPTGNLGQCVVTVPARYLWKLNELLVPTHELVADALVEQLAGGLKLADGNLDNLLTDLVFADERCTTSVADAVNGQQLTITFGQEFANCVVFIPPHREAVCVEPYTTAPDPFRLQTMGVDAHLRLLAPGAMWRSWVEMKSAAAG